MSREIEEGLELKLDFGKLQKIAATGAQVVPAVAQDVDTGEVILIGYVNQLALEETLKRRMAVFWSTSRNELWIKGQTSGDFLDLEDVRVNCEQNSLLFRVRPRGEGACHTLNAQGKHRPTCYYRRIENLDGHLTLLDEERE